MKILLYNPKVAKRGYQRLPHSILQLGALLEGKHDYAIIDGNLDQDSDKATAIIEKVRKEGIRYLGVTVMPGPQLVQTVLDLQKIRPACPDLKIIVGGYFPTSHPDTCARSNLVDFVVVGPGEDTFLELIETLEAGKSPDSVAGLAFQRDGQTIKTPAREPHHPEHLPWYPYHRVPVERYVTKTFLGSRTLSHHSSFGCPFTCNFCAVVKLAEGKWLAESAARLGELTEHMVKTWGINALEFHDNNFFTSERRVAEYCEQLLKRSLTVNWWGEGRLDTMLKFKPDTWSLMQRSGLKMVFMGAESADDAVLERMNKGGTQTAEKALQMAAHAKKYGIVPEFSFIVGNPPHPREDILKNISFIRKVKQLNPDVEIILQRYDPVPLAGDMLESVELTGFSYPKTFEEWAEPHWQGIVLRRSADTPWFSRADRQLLADFQTVLNAYYPTSTDRRSRSSVWRLALRALSGWRYLTEYYHSPAELRLLQKWMAYQRPEISGF